MGIGLLKGISLKPPYSSVAKVLSIQPNVKYADDFVLASLNFTFTLLSLNLDRLLK
jgi:hypothetical protein|tara:strand:+ start:2282 stop:2449 length:168 start_codon:yes stop_codon:yes gene_type:complete